MTSRPAGKNSSSSAPVRYRENDNFNYFSGGVATIMQVLEKNKRGSSVFINCVLLAVFCVPPGTCLADRGSWHMSTEPVTLTESGQRAIIGWDGQTQVLCLATDVSASKETTVIEFLPLPSKPNVTLGNREAFEAVEKVLSRRDVRFFKKGVRFGKGDRGLSEGTEPFQITFHQRLGAHDITIVKVNRPDEFADWVQEKAKTLTEGQVSLPDSIRKLIAKYLNEYHCPYFVFDVVEVGPDRQSVEPIIYEFKSPVVFYPLEISSTFHGQTSIDLIVFAEDVINNDPFWTLDFQLSNIDVVDANDMQEVLPRLKELLGETAWVQAFRYTGDIGGLKGNITVGLRRGNLAYTSGEYSRAMFRSFYSGVFSAILGGVIITFASLCPLYFAAKRQRPRWGIRLLYGFLLGMPLGFGLIFGVMNLLRELGQVSELFRWTYYYSARPVILIACSMGMGFIIFCFQLGLRRRWYLWWLVYVALAVPLAFVTDPNRIEDLFEQVPWIQLWDEMAYIFFAYLIVFIVLFLIARFVVWITGPRKRERSSLGR
jgi:hypothetical protein